MRVIDRPHCTLPDDVFSTRPSYIVLYYTFNVLHVRSYQLSLFSLSIWYLLSIHLYQRGPLVFNIF